MEATHILKLRQMGMTETERFNKNYVHPKWDEIKVTDVKRNPDNRRVYFISVANPEVLKQLVQSYDYENKRPIEPNHITHNRFAVYGYQLEEIKKSTPKKKVSKLELSKEEKLKFIVNYINDGGGAIQFHYLNELFLSTFDADYNKTESIMEACHGINSKKYDIATLDIDAIYAECLKSK